MNKWDGERYDRFSQERTQPAHDLARAIPLTAPKKIIDIGCGTGNSTAALRARFPQADIVGADYSEEMLATARSKYPDMTFIPFDATKDFSSLRREYDVVFSNACIQWVPDHPTLLRNMMNILVPGGVLAVQIPMNHQEPIHQIVASLVQGARWREKFHHPRIFYQLSQEAYFDLLSGLARDFSLWQTTYFHRMPSHDSIMDWYKGTGLRPYLASLDAADAAAFEAEVFAQVQAAYPEQANGEIIFRFPRFFFIATK